jgi:transcriptional regulator with XRE-family HTH domain
MRSARSILVEKLKFARETIAGLTVAELAEKAKASRAWLTAAEKGEQNFQIDEYERVILACGATFEELFAAPDTSQLKHQDLFWMLKVLVERNDERGLDAIRYILNRATAQPRPGPSTQAEGNIAPKEKKKPKEKVSG